MKNKKLFAILTLVAFMLTMMPVMAFATTSADIYAWVEDGSAKANGTDEVIAYVDFEKLAADEAIYVYTAKAGQAYDAVQMTLDNGYDGGNGFCFTSASGNNTENRKIAITANKAAELTLKVVLVKAVAGEDPTGLTMAQVNKGTSDDFDFFAVDVEDSAIKFKSTAGHVDAKFDVDWVKYDNGEVAADNAVLAANGGVDYYKVTVTLEDAEGDAVKNEEVSVEFNKAGVAVSEDTLTTNNRGVVKFNVYATKNGTYEITLSADDAEDKTFEVSFGTAGIGSVKVAAQPTGNTALGDTLTVVLNVTDTNGNVLNGDSLANLINARDIQFVAVPEDSDIEKDTIFEGDNNKEEAWFQANTRNKLVFKAKVDEPGDYTVKLYSPSTGAGVEYIYFTVAEFDKAVSASIAYDQTTYMLGADVEAPTVNVYDANGTKKDVSDKADFSYTGVGVVGFDKENGTFKVSDDDKYLGQQIVVNVVAEKCFATTTLNIADVPAYLQFDAAAASVGTEADVTVKSLDLKGNVAALGEQYTIEEVSYVVTAKPEGAIVSVDADNLVDIADFKTKGSETIAIASNKEGTVTVNVVVEASKPAEDQKVETIFLTGIATVDFGGKVTTVASSATMIIGSNVFVANGGVLTAPVAPAIVDGRTYLPIRALSQALGCEVGYADGVVTITYGTTVVTMTIGSNVMTVGAETVQIDAAPYVVDGTTMVPLRAAATALGYDIDVTYNVDGTVATVTVYKK